jgi:hypothetical protein
VCLSAKVIYPDLNAKDSETIKTVLKNSFNQTKIKPRKFSLRADVVCLMFVFNCV